MGVCTHVARWNFSYAFKQSAESDCCMVSFDINCMMLELYDLCIYIFDSRILNSKFVRKYMCDLSHHLVNFVSESMNNQFSAKHVVHDVYTV